MQKKQIYLNSLIIDLLQKAPVFSMFSENEIRKMLYSGELVKIERYKPMDIVIQEGDYGKWVYMLLSGSVKVVKQGAEICTLEKQGDIIGEIGAVKTMPRSASVIAIKNTICLAINLGAIENMSGEEKTDYLQRFNDFFTPLIESRLQKTLEVDEIMNELKKKKAEIARLHERLRQLGVSEERSILQLLLETDD
jgi:CRP-like cAMP-binding protein